MRKGVRVVLGKLVQVGAQKLVDSETEENDVKKIVGIEGGYQES